MGEQLPIYPEYWSTDDEDEPVNDDDCPRLETCWDEGRRSCYGCMIRRKHE